MNQVRHEWRGDAFAADLDAILQRLRPLPLLPRAFEHTLTVFLHPRDAQVLDLARVKRLRAYRTLPAINAEEVATLLDGGLAGTLQAKARSGGTRSLGSAIVTRSGIAGLRAGSVRVSKRLHFSVGHDPDPERMRVTVDLDRHLFHIDRTGRIDWLGQLGPRVEVKAPTKDRVDSVRLELGLDTLARRQPNRSLELLLQEMLRQQVEPAPHGFPEMELKFDLLGHHRGELLPAVHEALGEVRLLLPPPHAIERTRRYHLCRDPAADDAEATIVETASGRLSLKRKRNPRRIGPVLLRDTTASRTTDRTGALVSVRDFAADNALDHVASFEKVQRKIPFARPDGHAFLVSVDHCVGLDGAVLDQVELEYIGTLTETTSTPAEVAEQLHILGECLLAGSFGGRLVPSTGSKHGFFSAQRLNLAS